MKITRSVSKGGGEQRFPMTASLTPFEVVPGKPDRLLRVVEMHHEGHEGPRREERKISMYSFVVYLPRSLAHASAYMPKEGALGLTSADATPGGGRWIIGND